MTGLFIRQPFVLPSNVIMALKYGHLPLGNLGNEKGRDFLPAIILIAAGDFMELQITRRTAIALDDMAVGTNMNRFEEPLIISELT